MPGSAHEYYFLTAFLNVLDNKHVNILGHINDVNYPVDYEKIIKKAKEKKVLIELNNGTLLRSTIRKDGIENAKMILELCKNIGAAIIIGSDAHIFTCVGNFEAALQLLYEIEFPQNLIINSKIDYLNQYIQL